MECEHTFTHVTIFNQIKFAIFRFSLLQVSVMMSCPVPLPLPLHAPAALHADYPPVHIGVKVRTEHTHTTPHTYKYVKVWQVIFDREWPHPIRFGHARIFGAFRVTELQLLSTNEIMCDWIIFFFSPSGPSRRLSVQTHNLYFIPLIGSRDTYINHWTGKMCAFVTNSADSGERRRSSQLEWMRPLSIQIPIER